ncbi:MAG: ACP phosphodiesterase [Chitinophagaceae bacterium]|nr:ACP phosphodiesterase [Chitinophagaceae bacterium]
MNYLAHAYLSFSHPGILVGNMISDFVKGKQKFAYSLDIQKGIALHRAIDQFTDQHPATKEAKEVFRPAYRLYSGAFVDVVYDHFLALDTQVFPQDGHLMEFSQQVYEHLDINRLHLPEPFGHFFPYMREQNWLYNYKHPWGIGNSFAGLARRATYINESNTAFQAFTTHYDYLKNCYTTFFPELLSFAEEEYKNLNI